MGVVMDRNRSEEDESMDVDEDPSKQQKKTVSSKGDDLAQYNLDDYDDNVKTTGMQAAASIFLSRHLILA
jgi:hypothetical protein